MGLYITQKTEGSATIIKVDGRLNGQGSRELARICRALDAPFVLDLTDLRHAGTHGLRLIHSLVDAGVQLVGVSPYIALLLDRP